MLSRLAAVWAVALAVLAPTPAAAHWCHDLWGSSYNIVVRPAADTVNVPATGSATLDLWVQNNMGYALSNFTMAASASTYTVTVARQAPKVAGFLLPGEKLKHTLTISKAGGAVLPVTSLSFYIGFGSGQDSEYGTGRVASPAACSGCVTMRKLDTTLSPARPMPGLGPHGPDPLQSKSLAWGAALDFGDPATAISTLMAEYCIGRSSWDTGGGAIVPTNCSPVPACPTTAYSGGATKYHFQHLWAAFELASRKSALGANSATLRNRLKCAAAGDALFAFEAFALEMLGYLGEDPGARTTLTGLIGSGSADEKAVAKAALLLFGDATDRTTYLADVTAGLSSASPYVKLTSATTLGIIDQNDAAVNTVLIPAAAKWLGAPEESAAKEQAQIATHLLALVARHRRVWAVDAADLGNVTFYGEGGAPDTVDPKAPTGVSCVASPGGTVRVSWTQVTQGVDNLPEASVSYRVYHDTVARPGGAQKPGDASGFTYAHVDPTGGIYFDFPALAGTSTFYFSVAAVDAATNQSVYSAEVSCVPKYAPVAVLTCVPMSGPEPLAVTCDGNASSDANGAGDITGYSFKLGAQAATTVNPVLYSLDAGNYLVQLTVTDSTGLTSSASKTINSTSDGGNSAPTAAANADRVSGPMPLLVTFSAAGSTDPDVGQTLSYSWDFADGSAAATTANPTHTFAAAGTYNVVLTVTDNGTPPLSSSDLVTVVVTGNRPPDVSTASASPRSGAAPLKVSFDASGVSDPDGDTVTATWNFGDGSPTTTTRLLDHTYATKGTYTATLSAQDDGLPAIGPATASFTITVGDVPASNRPPDCSAATVTPSTGAAPLQVTLDASGCTDPDGDALTYTWHIPTAAFTDRVVNGAKSVETLPNPGSVEINLVVTDQAASPMETTRTFKVLVTGASGGGDGAVVGALCGCGSGAAAAPGLLAAFAAALGLAARRRKGRS
jgi:PKD repeat protein